MTAATPTSLNAATPELSPPADWQTSDVPLNPLGPLLTMWRHRALIFRLGRRDIEALYRGTWLGLCWLVIQPLLLLAVYTFVFTVIFKPKVASATDGAATPALTIFTGLILFNIFAEALNRAPRLLHSNRVYVSQVIFPIEILPVVALGTALFQGLLSFMLLLGAFLIFDGWPPLTLISIPLVVLPLLLLTLGFCWFLASLGVFVRDVAPFVGVTLRVLLFLCPIFYPLEAVPGLLRQVIMANPVATAVCLSRGAIFAGVWPNPWHLGIYWCASILVCWAGYAWFMKTRKAFGDVL